MTGDEESGTGFIHDIAGHHDTKISTPKQIEKVIVIGIAARIGGKHAVPISKDNIESIILIEIDKDRW